MKLLKDLTATLVAAGCRKPRMERSYNRVAGYREVLIRTWTDWRTPGKMLMKAQRAEGELILNELVAKLTAEGFEVTHNSWEISGAGSIEIWVQAKVAPSDVY